MPVTFIEDREQDIRFMLEMFLPRTQDATTRAREAGIPDDFLARVRNVGTRDESLGLFRDFAAARYKEDERILTTAIQAYQEIWDRIDHAFFSEIRNITGHEWQFPEYRVIVSLFHRGISNSNENSVIRWAYDVPEEHTRITAHEILMIQLWYVFDQYFPEAAQDADGSFWMLNELTTTAMLGLEPSLDVLWSRNQRGYDGFLQNYPTLSGYKEKAKSLYMCKSSLLSFLLLLRKEVTQRQR